MEQTNEKYKVWWDADKQIVRAEVLNGAMSVDLVKKLKDDIFQIIKKHNDNVLGLVNVGKVVSTAPVDSRKIFAEILKNPGIKKIAFFGTPIPIVTKVIVNFVITASGNKNARLFSTEEEALKWLKEE